MELFQELAQLSIVNDAINNPNGSSSLELTVTLEDKLLVSYRAYHRTSKARWEKGTPRYHCSTWDQP